ncbi:hypothetical protein [Paenibacillus agilis]|uniref:Uncharacterized protein n=1 Tax=Paenibacillus agilis TaxID=3020863 RepID=A0A559IX60_9BACL|nr:hypothetical protein [Paenibacillus agilis]TVX92228.1 hypothetical protein FPZ44_03635 [Paenibacillus agilis]
MVQTDKTLQLLKLLAGLGGNPADGLALRIAEVKTTEPDEVTLIMSGTNIALDLDLFETPVDVYPLRVGDRLLVYPLVTMDSGRWAVLAKVTSGKVMATMKSANSLQPDGMAITYNVDRLLIPADFTDVRQLKAGDRVGIAPVVDGDRLKYMILNKY